MRDGVSYSGLTTQEIQVLIDFICTEDIMPIIIINYNSMMFVY